MTFSEFYIDGKKVETLYIDGVQVSLGGEPEERWELCFTAEEPGSTVKMTRNKSSAPTVNLQTSTDGRTWTPYTIDNTITLANVGDKVYWKAVGSNAAFSTSTGNYNYFVMTGSILASGNTNSLLNENSETAQKMAIGSSAFWGLFSGCRSLKSVPDLPGKSIASSSYREMFKNCSGITTVDYNFDLTTVKGGYVCSSMFEGCTSLTRAPDVNYTGSLNATNYGFSKMFSGCTSLENAPKIPQGQTGYSDYMFEEMFTGCTALKNAPTLTGVSVQYSGTTGTFKGMFKGCTSLVTAPRLPTVGSRPNTCREMFKGCTALKNAPALPQTTVANTAYYEMFAGCTSLETAPALPATTLGTQSYYGMFSGCTSLKTAPNLPATTLTSGCYGSMFKNSGIESITVGFTNWDPTNATTDWLPETTGTFNCPWDLITNTSERTTSTVPASWSMVAV